MKRASSQRMFGVYLMIVAIGALNAGLALSGEVLTSADKPTGYAFTCLNDGAGNKGGGVSASGMSVVVAEKGLYPQFTAATTWLGCGSCLGGGSVVDSSTLNFIHRASDWRAGGSSSACSPCGGAAAGATVPPLELTRLHRSRNLSVNSSLSPGVFLSYDFSLRLTTYEGGNRIYLFDPNSYNELRLDDGLNFDALDGIYQDQTSKSIKDLRLYDGAGGTGSLVTDISQGVSAVLRTLDGRKYTFEIVDMDGPAPDAWAHWKLDEGTGATAEDESANDRDGTLVGGPAWVTGQSGQAGDFAVAFDGVNDYMSVANLSSALGGTATMSFWFKSTGTGSTLPHLSPGISGADGSGFSDMYWGWIDNFGWMWMRAGGVGNVSAPFQIADGTWKHLVLARDAETGRVAVYVDGSLEGSGGSGQGDISTAFTSIARIEDSSGAHVYLDATLDDIRVYDRALHIEEIARITGNGEKAGRLVRYENRRGHGITLNYKSWTPAEIAESPERQWQFDTITDDNNRTLTFTYHAAQQSGRWAVSKVVLPNTAEVEYHYTDGFLSSIDQTDGTTSTFTRTVDGASGQTIWGFDDAAADGQCRRMDACLSGLFLLETPDQQTIYSQAALICRAVVNGEDELIFGSYFNTSFNDYWRVYEGAGRVKELSLYTHDVRYLSDGWTYNASNPNEFARFVGTLEDTFVDENGGNFDRSTPSQTITSTGVVRSHGYSSAGFIGTTTYSDATTEKYQYSTAQQGGNQFNLVTRYKDRIGRVTKMTYDAVGNLTLREVGIREVGGADVNQPEYATYQNAYYDGTEGPAIVTGDAGVDAAAADPQPEHLLKSSTDANGNVTFRLYDVNLQLIAVVEPDDTGAGHHIAMKFTYDSARRQKTSTDAVGREMEYFYDDRDRAIMVRYTDGSTERTLFGNDAGQTQNLVVATQDRDGTVTSFEYDDQGRLEKTITASHKIPTADVIDETKTDLGALLAGNEITDVNVKVERTCTYLDGTGLLASCTDRGETTTYGYDYRQRRIERTVQPRGGQTLTSKTKYIDNLVFSTEDPYGRKSFNAYRASDSALIRSVQATVPGPAGEPADFADVLALARAGTPSAPDVNGEYLITDSELDAAGQQFATIDPRGVVHATEFDSRGRTVKSVEAATDAASYDPADFEDGIVETALAAIAAKTETDYDDQSNTTEVRHPRFFDTTDTEGENTCKTVRTYTRRNLTETETVAAGADAYVAGDPLKVKVTRSFTYRLDRTADTRTDFRGEDWATLWHLCCQRAIVAIDPTATVDDSGTDKQAGGVTFYSGYGDATHRGTIADFANFTAPTGEINDASYNTDLTDADTLHESTTRYDARHRPTHQTVWLVPAYEQGGTGAINPQNPPIVGGGDTIDPPLEVTGVKQGLTTRWLYDENLTDGVGLDSAAGVSVPNLSGTGSFNVSIADLLTELAADGTSFAAGSDGYAVVVVTPEQELSVSISDGAGRSVASAALDPLDQTSPVTAPITWNTVQHDAVTTVTGFGDVLETANHDALDHVTKSRSDGAGRALESEDALGNVTEIGYNENGAAVSVLDPNEVGWDAGTALGTFDGYDARNRLTDRIDTNGDTSSSVYDKNNNVTLTTDAKGQTDTCRFDARDRKYSCVDRVSSDTRLRYDQNSNLTIQKDGEDQQTEYMYDERNLKVFSQFPDHVVGQNPGDANYGITTCTYDAAKRKFRYEDQLGDTKTHIYDMADRLKQRDYRLRVNSPSGTIADSDVMTYDDSSRVLTAVSGRYSNTVTLTYDDASRKATEKLTILSKNFKVTSTYDAANRRTQIKYPDNVLVDREYTDRDQLEFVKYTNTAAGGTLTSFILDKRTYDNGMRLEKCEQNFSGAGGTPRVTTDNTFRGNVGDPGDDLIESITRTGLTGADYTYSYDANKNKLKETINAPLANYGFGSTVGQEATYDGEDRLTNWHRDDTLRDLNWVITKVGDFSSYSVEGVAETRTHPSAHELTSITGGPNAGTLSYDAKGNLTTRSDNFSFVWDFDNQLKEVTVPAGSTLGNVGTHKYYYDALGRRVMKHVAGENKLIFVHDDDQIIAEYKYTNGVIGVPGGIDASTSTTSQSTQTQDSAVIIGTRRGTATIQRKYMYTSYIDERCLMVDRTALGASPAGTEELFYYHSNNLYSVGAMTDAAGAVTERYAYDAYGQIVFLNAAGTPLATQASTIGQPYTYTGRRLDEETFLNHYRARYYDAFVMQRFIGRDPILYGDGYNMYAYVGGGPVNKLDPLGLQEELPWQLEPKQELPICGIKKNVTKYYSRYKDKGRWRNFGYDYEVAFHKITVSIDGSNCCFCKGLCHGKATMSLRVETTRPYKFGAPGTAAMDNSGIYIPTSGAFFPVELIRDPTKTGYGGEVFVSTAKNVGMLKCNSKRRYEGKYFVTLKPSRPTVRPGIEAHHYTSTVKATIESCGRDITLDFDLNFVNNRIATIDGRRLKELTGPDDPNRPRYR